MTKIRTQINLEEDQYNYLRLQSKLQNRTISELVRRAVDKQSHTRKNEKRPSLLEALAKNAISFKNVNPDVPSDLSINHDQYLYGRKSKWAYLRKTHKSKRKKI